MISKKQFLDTYNINESELKEFNIDWQDLKAIHDDFLECRKSYETQADLIANILRGQPKVHSVKTRIKVLICRVNPYLYERIKGACK